MTRMSAVIVAAGASQRFLDKFSSQSGARLASKVFVQWKDHPLFVHTLSALASLELREVCLVIRPEDQNLFETEVSKANLPFKVIYTAGGKRRQDSARNGLQALADCDRVAIHDAARPFLSPDFLSRLRLASEKNKAVIPVLKIHETVKEIDADGKILKTVDRNRLVRVQTPQIFDFNLIKNAHDNLKESGQEFTDDAAMLEFLGESVMTCEGDLRNIKVTTPEDLEFMGGIK